MTSFPFSLLIKLLYLGNHILHLLVYFQEVGIEDALTRLETPHLPFAHLLSLRKQEQPEVTPSLDLYR